MIVVNLRIKIFCLYIFLGKVIIWKLVERLGWKLFLRWLIRVLENNFSCLRIFQKILRVLLRYIFDRFFFFIQGYYLLGYLLQLGLFSFIFVSFLQIRLNKILREDYMVENLYKIFFER